MKVKVLVAACVPIGLFLLLSITVIAITCVIIGYKQRKAELHFKEKVAKEPRKVVEVLSQTVPKSMYPRFLDFAAKIMSGSCEVCQNSHSLMEGDRGKEVEGEDDFDGVIPVEGVHGNETMLIMQAEDRDASSQMVTSIAKVIQSGLDNPKIGGQLSNIMMAMLAARGSSGVLPPVDARGKADAVPLVTVRGAMDMVPTVVTSPPDLGYSGSNSGSTHSESTV